jgi:hypothetical protein
MAHLLICRKLNIKTQKMSATNQSNDLQSRIKTWLTSRNTLKNFAGLLVGIIGGYLYYRLIGCNSGGCAITSNPYMSVLWGGLMGYLLADIFKIKEKTPISGNEEK